MHWFVLQELTTYPSMHRSSGRVAASLSALSPNDLVATATWTAAPDLVLTPERTFVAKYKQKHRITCLTEDKDRDGGQRPPTAHMDMCECVVG